MSLRFKIIVSINILVFVFMISLASILVHLRSREITSTIEKEALRVATLTAGPLCDAFEDYYESGYFKFRQFVLSLLSLDKKLISVEIYTVEGKEVFDSDEFKGSGVGQEKGEDISKLTERIKHVNPSFSSSSDRSFYDMVFPYMEPWGWHRYSVRYVFSKNYLHERIAVLRNVIFSVTLVSIILASFFSYFLVTMATKPLEKLTDTARDISNGNFDRRIEVHGNDEIGILGSTMEDMINKIKDDMELLESQKKTLSETNAELKRLNDLKSQFLASVSHELKTPLTSIKGYIDYIYREGLGPLNIKQKRGLEVTKRNLKRLDEQIENLLDFSSFEAGKIDLSLTPFHIRGAVEEAIADIDARFSEKEIEYDADIATDIPPVIADRGRIIQVLENLLTNAVKFSKPGGKILVSCNRLNGKQDEKVKVCVQDYGIGIPNKMKNKVFQNFFQIDPKNGYKGLGLGLSIVKSILDAHSENIELKSKYKKGSTFCFTLPIYGSEKK
jgi:signal transduction histidine kinase